MEIVNRSTNFKPNTCQFVNSENKICNINTNEFNNLRGPFEELRKASEPTSNIAGLKEATGRVRERTNALIRIKRKEENSGYVLVGSLTCLGTLAIGTIIFMAIKLIVVG